MLNRTKRIVIRFWKTKPILKRNERIRANAKLKLKKSKIFVWFNWHLCVAVNEKWKKGAGLRWFVGSATFCTNIYTRVLFNIPVAFGYLQCMYWCKRWQCQRLQYFLLNFFLFVWFWCYQKLTISTICLVQWINCFDWIRCFVVHPITISVIFLEVPSRSRLFRFNQRIWSWPSTAFDLGCKLKTIRGKQLLVFMEWNDWDGYWTYFCAISIGQSKMSGNSAWVFQETTFNIVSSLV